MRVKSRKEIRRTLDREAHNRGLSFDLEMTAYCGKELSVQRVVSKIIDEFTGRMLHPAGRCLVLDGAVCQSRYHGLCQRKTEPYWREIWLERLEASPQRASRSA